MSLFPFFFPDFLPKDRSGGSGSGAATWSRRAQFGLNLNHFLLEQRGEQRFVDFGFEQSSGKEVLVKYFLLETRRGAPTLPISLLGRSARRFSASFTATRAAMSLCARQKLTGELPLL